ncbi:hypothetical protein BKA93DRAFT_876798 [Sparassis latifolia]
MLSYAVVGGSRGIGLEFVRQLSTVFAMLVRDKARSSYLASVVATSQQPYTPAAAKIAQLPGGGLDVLIQNIARMENENLYRGLTKYFVTLQLRVDLASLFSSHPARAKNKRTKNSYNQRCAYRQCVPTLLRKGTGKKIVVISTAIADRVMVWKMRVESMAAYGMTKAGTARAQEDLIASPFSTAQDVAEGSESRRSHCAKHKPHLRRRREGGELRLQAAAMPPVVGWWKTIVWDRCVDPLNRGWLVLVLQQQIQSSEEHFYSENTTARKESAEWMEQEKMPTGSLCTSVTRRTRVYGMPRDKTGGRR